METDTYSAKTHLSRLLDQVERGEEVIITRRGKRIARLVRYEEVRRPRIMGLLAGQIPEAELDWNKHKDPEWQAMLDQIENKPIG